MLGLLIDIDDTVYPVEPCHASAMRTAQELGRMLVPDWSDALKFTQDYHAAREVTHHALTGFAASHCRLLYFQNMLEKHGVTAVTQKVRSLHDAYWEGYMSAMKIEPGCLEALTRATANGFRVCWVSNFTTERQIQKLETLGLDTVGLLVTSEEAGQDKPSLSPFRLACKKLGATYSQCTFIGDDWRADILPSRALGMRSIWLSRKNAMTLSAEVPLCRNWSEIENALYQGFELASSARRK